MLVKRYYAKWIKQLCYEITRYSTSRTIPLQKYYTHVNDITRYRAYALLPLNLHYPHSYAHVMCSWQWNDGVANI